MRQTTITTAKDVKKQWFIIDAKDQNLGRLAAFVASILRGKNKPTFTPNVDMGDNVIIINARQVVLAAEKEDKKQYYTHSGYPGGLKVRTAREQRAHKPTSLVEKAIKGMLPHTALGRKQLSNLYVYAEGDHNHAAQQPQRIEVK